MRLGVNIDHIATLRNARGGSHPDPIRAASEAAEAGADGITIHLREDRRHIRDNDLSGLISEAVLPVNLEMAATQEMLAISLENRPNAVCLVPEKREELTTEGGLDVAGKIGALRDFVEILTDKGIKVTTFVDPEEEQVNASLEVGADAVELHVGRYCSLFDNGVDNTKELSRIQEISRMAAKLGLKCHAGHGLGYGSVVDVAKIAEISELNIGHFLIGESVFCGLRSAVTRMREIINMARCSQDRTQ